MSSDLVFILVGIVGLPLVLALLAKAFPAKPRVPSDRPLAELKELYAGTELRQSMVLLGFGVVFSVLWFVVLVSLGAWAALRLPSAQYAMTTGGIYFGVPAILLGIVSAAIPADRFLRRRLGDRYGHFMDYQTLKYGFDPAVVSKLVTVIACLGCGVFVLVGVDWYVLIQSDRLVVNGYFSVSERVHPFGTIVDIKTAPALIAPNGNTVSRREYVIVFRSGETWSTNYLPNLFPRRRNQEVIEYISRASGVPIRNVEVFQRDEL